MLFVWDLHLKSDMKEKIFKKLREILDKTKEKEIIFLWDYVYHFNYNPKIIWEFFDILLHYSQNWKKVIILAWNHDYISWHFIFSEAEKLSNLAKNENLQIISSPKVLNIENENILFFPFFTKISEEEEFIEIDKKIKKTEQKNKQFLINLFFTAYGSRKQDNKNMKISWSINLELIKILLENENIDTIVHHFYIEGTSFPGQFSKFSFKNIALSRELFNFDWKLVSWHLHKSFIHKNYTCVGSFRNTSPLEENDTKVVFVYPNKFEQVFINPYISIDVKESEKVTKSQILNKWKEVEKEAEELLDCEIKKDEFKLKQINLTIKSNNHLNINDILSLDLLNDIKEIKLIQKTERSLGNILNELEVNAEKLSYSFESWKNLAKNYIEKKYPESKSEYFKILSELDLM